MNTISRSAVRLATTLSLAVVVTSSGCGQSRTTGTRTYTLQGQILSVAPERKETVVKHEAIAGFMQAMTMPYVVRDVKEIAEIRPGDLITSTLVLEEGGAFYLRGIRKVGDAPLERSASRDAEVASNLPSNGTPPLIVLNEGDPTPNAAFVDQEGRTRDFASFRGSTVVLTFIYTKCPMPTFCPLMDRHFVTIQSKLAEQPALKNVHLVTVSFDPAHDTPDVLKRHATSLGADPTRWTFLTGDPVNIEAFASRFGVSIMREKDAPDITHNLRTAIIGANGTLAKAYSGNDWTPAQLIADLARLGSSS